MPGNEVRFGISTPRSSGIAVRRNRFKRLLRVAYRERNLPTIAKGALLIILKRTDSESDLADEMMKIVELAMARGYRRTAKADSAAIRT